MKWIDRLERKFGRYGIDNLMMYIVALTGLVYMLSLNDPTGRYLSKLVLVPSLVMQGEVWRLFTYIFIPPQLSPFFIVFALYFYYLIGRGLEQEWGVFRFNMFYLLGYLGTTLAVFITGSAATSYYLNLSLFLAFAWIYPNFELLLFFIIPIKIKYLALVDLFYLISVILFGSVPDKIAVLIALLNLIIFFGQDLISGAKLKKQVYHNKRSFRKNNWAPKNQPFHKCTVCGITEKDDPTMEFRYCSKCEGSYEYCMDHLNDHQHIKKLDQEN